MIQLIEVRDLTGGEVKGAGVFDELMRTVKDHTLAEYDAGRIHGADYATVYLGALQNVLQMATQFTLQYPLTNQEILLKQEQIKQAVKQNELLELQKEQLRIANATAQFHLDKTVVAQYEGVLAQNKILGQQFVNLKIEEQNLLKQVEMITLQIEGQTTQNANLILQGTLLNGQILTEKANTSEPTGGLTKAQYDKLLQEIAILKAKAVTEEAQTKGDETTLGGVVGTQIALNKGQLAGFKRDAEQKAAKILQESFSVAYSLAPESTSYTPDKYNLHGPYAKGVMVRLMEGIGATPVFTEA